MRVGHTSHRAWILGCALAAGCSSSSGNGFTPGADAGGDSSGGARLDSGAPAVDGGADGATFCKNDDCDGDGYSPPADCNDDNALINPAAYDFVGDGLDNDCDGKVDDPVLHCETVPATPPGTPADFARAADLCAQNSKTNAGTIFDPLVRAEWGQVSGLGPGETLWTSMTKPTIQTDIVSSLGSDVPRQGKTMAGLANGPWAAADPRDSLALDPSGFQLSDACSDIPLAGTDCASLTNGSVSGGVNVQDWAELALTVQVPSNVKSVVFDFAFFSSEFNQWWDSAANDAFFVLVTSKELSGQNVAHDSHGLAVTVNSGYFQLCPAPPGPAMLSEPAAIENCVGLDGDAAQMIFGTLAGTGYDGAAKSTNDTVNAVNGDLYVYGGGSGWLTTSFAVTPNEQIQMRVIIADTFDGLKDSAVLLDNMRWEAASESGTGRPSNAQ
jgi:hypothetical protein